MKGNKTLERLVNRAEFLRKANKVIGLVQIPITFFTHTKSGFEGYLNSNMNVVAISTLAATAYAIFSNTKKYQKTAKDLVDEGIYGTVRHPMYLSFRLGSLGLMMYNPSMENLITGGILFLASELTARAEERKLEYLYLKEYQQYKEKVPRWIPYEYHLRSFIKNIKNKIVNSSRKSNPS